MCTYMNMYVCSFDECIRAWNHHKNTLTRTHTHTTPPLNRLHKGEWLALGTLTLLYLGASMLDEASEIAGAFLTYLIIYMHLCV